MKGPPPSFFASALRVSGGLSALFFPHFDNRVENPVVFFLPKKGPFFPQLSKGRLFTFQLVAGPFFFLAGELTNLQTEKPSLARRWPSFFFLPDNFLPTSLLFSFPVAQSRLFPLFFSERRVSEWVGVCGFFDH